ncbi:PE-PPE domain-containing protein [Mycobacterium sp. PS03-16]|nr:PE-PPE domain-containing protein [Mycobacterium sp. PS03-16]
MSVALTLSQAATATAATIPTADTVVGVGGFRNPTSDRIPRKFEGELVPPGQRFVGVRYPAQLPVDPSVAEGQQPLRDAVALALDDGTVLVAGYSEGSLVAERYKRALVAAGSPDRDDIRFLFIAAPIVPNGGIYARFPGLRILGFTSTGAAAPSPYDETFVTLEYDLIGDFPAYANPLSLANAVAGLVYVHGDQGPDNVDLQTAPQSVKVVDTEAGGRDTYILIHAAHLPLLRPVRDVSAVLRTTALTEPLLAAVEPTLRLLVDMGYTDRDYRNADEPTPFSLFTPPERIVETVTELPRALRESADGFVDAVTPPGRQQRDHETPAGGRALSTGEDDAEVSSEPDEPAEPKRSAPQRGRHSAPEDDEPDVADLTSDSTDTAPEDADDTAGDDTAGDDTAGDDTAGDDAAETADDPSPATAA